MQKGCKQWVKHAVSFEFYQDFGRLMQPENVTNMGPLDIGANYRYKVQTGCSIQSTQTSGAGGALLHVTGNPTAAP